ncbi:MAG TPA: metallophosphoesterase family protein, partial [Actinomycetota bacterium]
YLQVPTPTSMVVRWRTDVATDSRVRYGAAPGSLGTMIDDGALVTDHEVAITALAPDTQYFYSVGTTTAELAGNDAAHHFRTSPPPGSAQPIRIWALGDSGFADPDACLLSPECDAPAVRDAYLALAGANDTDLLFLLGDNAYLTGTDAQFQEALFDMHADFLRRVPPIPTFGNHEALSSNSAMETGPWFDMFTNPTAGEAGGVMSGTEAYYSMDYGNVHVIVLDSQGSSREPGSAMLTWLETDIMGATADWIIAFWHHPPYSKGFFHDSDVEGREIDMRENVVPILEANGVDLVLSGHSHNYERSYMLDGHYDFSPTLTGDMILDAGSGDPASDGAYRKASLGAAPNEGAVYVVSGSASEVRNATLNHPAHRIGLLELGSLVLDVDGTTLSARFLNDAGAVTDTFTIVKGAAACPAAPRTGCEAGGKGKLVVKKGSATAGDGFVWKWKDGALDVADLGDPLAETDLAVCLWDASGLLTGGGLPPGSGGANPAWLPKGVGVAYRDAAASAAGVQKMRIKPGDASTAKLAVKGKGPNLGLPGALAVTTPITAQLANLDGGTCWESVFTTTKKNGATKVVARVAP